jgi:hypothetical protein
MKIQSKNSSLALFATFSTFLCFLCRIGWGTARCQIHADMQGIEEQADMQGIEDQVRPSQEDEQIRIEIVKYLMGRRWTHCSATGGTFTPTEITK